MSPTSGASTLAEPKFPPQADAGGGDGGHDGERVSVQLYLCTAYAPDCELVDGRLEERNLGEWDHARLQGRLLQFFMNKEAAWEIQVAPECRLQVRADRYRVPDVMVLRAEQVVDRIVREAPLLCLEVLSPEDTWKRLMEKVRDYLELGVRHIWAFDPQTREAYLCDAEGFHRAHGTLEIEGTPIKVDLEEIFSALELTRTTTESS